MRSLLLGLLVLILLGIGTWTMLGPPTDQVENIEGSFVEVTENAGYLQPTDNAVLLRPREVSSGLQRDALNLPVDSLDRKKEHDFHLIVVSPKDLTPLPGAEVFLQQDPNLNLIWDHDQTGPIPATPIITSEDGILGPFLTDAEGSVYLPTPDKDDLIIARHGNAIGFRTSEDRERWQEGMLKVYPDQTLRVHAVDVDGNPVSGCPIGLYRGRSQLQTVLVATTDSEGVARFHTPRFYLQGQTNTGFHLGHLGHGVTPSVGPYSFAKIPQDATVVVRPTASWTVKMQYADGSPFDGYGWISLQSMDQAPHTFAHLQVPVEAGGSITLDGLEPEVLFQIEAGFEPCQSRLEFQQASPSAGQKEELILKLTEEVHRMQVLLSDPGGEPFANQEASIAIWGTYKQPSRLWQMHGVTDSNGKLDVAFLSLDDEWQLRFSNRVIIAEAQAEHDGLWLQAEIPFHEDLYEKTTPTTLILEPKPVLAGGIVVDSLGAPVIGLSINAQEAGNDFWPDNYARGTTDAQGQFILQGNPPPKEAELKVYPPSQDIAPVPLNVGAMDHRIEIKATPFHLKGRFLLPEFLHATGWGTSVFFQQGDLRYFINGYASQGIVDVDLAVSSQIPGRLILQLRGFGEVAALEEIVPATPDGLQDSRIQPWDLRQFIALAEVEVFLGPVRVDDFTIQVEEKGDRAGRFQQIKVNTEEGARFMLPQGLPLLVRISGKGLRATDVTIKPGRQVIHAKAAIRGTFQLTGDGVVPKGYRLSFSGRPKRNTRFQRRFRENSPPDWAIDFQEPGIWTCRLRLEEIQGDKVLRSTKLSVKDDSNKSFEIIVPEKSDAFTVEIQLTKDAINQALTELHAKSKE